MDFGMIPYDNLTIEAVQLPKPFLPNALSGSVATTPKLYVGLPKWGNPHFKGKIYPTVVKDSQMLTYYAKAYNSIELNSTHYSIYSNSVISKWSSMVANTDFLFCPKFVNKISHLGTPDPETKKEVTDAFLSSIYEFKNHLGPAFIQFPDSFTIKRYSVLMNYLRSLPTDIDIFVECRNESWFSDKQFFESWVSELNSINKGIVITDTPGRRDIMHMQLSIPKAFIRFVCRGDNSIDTFRIKQWKDQLRFWFANGLNQCFFFLHINDNIQELEFSKWVQTELAESLK